MLMGIFQLFTLFSYGFGRVDRLLMSNSLDGDWKVGHLFVSVNNLGRLAIAYDSTPALNTSI
jgi:hypothetical protein